MVLDVCKECKYGEEKDGKSHCSKETIYSYLTNCIKAKALDFYLEYNKYTSTGLNMVCNK